MSERIHRPREDEDLLHAAVREAGALAAGYFNGSTQSWTKDDGTPVSDADLAVDELLKSRLLPARPDYGWLSEETDDNDDRLANSRVWVVDPIDGTRSFLEGGEHWCVTAALVEDGRPAIGVVYLPLSDKMYAARAGEGASMNGQLLIASTRNELAGSKMIAHKSILQPHRWQTPWPDVDVGMTTSLALRLCLVADGSFDAALAVGSKCDWDLAAGDLIVHEAGGRVCDLGGATLRYNKRATRQDGLIASGANLHDEIIRFSSGYKPN
ncbi:MAG: 3'(2'),5'-bisphosphate nucleotidase CysQ [Rhizobiales bacterium]|nr:3'(2'),5'-bisphosphate nucleotidase CysQ [Hyphomicrobiales bacterium]